MSDMISVWSAIEKLHNEDFNLIPVRDKSDGVHAVKTPFQYWTKYKTEKLDLAKLNHLMYDYHHTTAVAVVCGKISGNLIIIDIDTKHKTGIDASIFADLHALYPNIFKSLRIHKTPSGGYHLLYRIEGTEVPASKNLASRLPTAQEKEINPKRPVYTFIEIKGEGGLSQMPPSPGYSVHQSNVVPVLSHEDSNSIINLMKGYTDIIEKPKEPKRPISDIDYYDENPFEHFNGSDAGGTILEDAGWKLHTRSNGNFIYFTHPESKSNSVHASFNRATRIYRIFTSNSDFNPDKQYNPSTLLSIMLHAGDKKKTFPYLVQKGYGKIKPKREEILAKKTATANKPLPANASSGAVALHAAISKKMATDHPYGIFWQQAPDSEGFIINREQLYTVADGLGFKLYNEMNIAQIQGNIIYERDTRSFIDALKKYIKEENAEIFIAIANAYEAFIERHGKFTISRLQVLNEYNIMIDTKTDCYKFFTNGMLHITKDNYQLKEIPIDKIVWNHKIQPRDFKEEDEGLYVDFLQKAIGLSKYLLQCIGCLCHEFKDGNGYAIVLTEQCENPKDGGGTGKNIFSEMFRHSTSFFLTPGSQIKYDEKFMQSWNYERIFYISDALKNFQFDFLKEFITGSAKMKKLYTNEFSIPKSKMPNFIVSTQFSYEIKDGGVRRRVRPLEFTDFFTKADGVDVYYCDKNFPEDWEEKDWNSFDTTIALAIQEWLKSKRKIDQPDLSDGGWKKQFEQTHGRITTAIIKAYWSEWIESGFISTDDFKSNCNTYYNENSIHIKYQPSSFNFNQAIQDYADKKGVVYKKDDEDSVQNVKVRGRSFRTKK